MRRSAMIEPWACCAVATALALAAVPTPAAADAAGAAGADDQRTVVRIADGRVIRVNPGEDGPVIRIVREETGYLGVNIEEEIEHPEGGARVTRVVQGSPAEDAGIREGDVVVGFDGAVVRGPAALTRRIHEHAPGEVVAVSLRRDGAEVDLEVELGRRGDALAPLQLEGGAWVLPGVVQSLEALEELGGVEVDLDAVTDALAHVHQGLGHAPRVECDGADCSYFYDLGSARPRLGVQLVEATPELRTHLGGSADRGVLVSKVLAGTPADRSGIHVGDLILSVGGDPIANVADLRRALAARAGERFVVEISRDARPLELEVTLPGGDDDEATGPRAAARPPAPAAPPLPPASDPTAEAPPVLPPAGAAVLPRPPRAPAPPPPRAPRTVRLPV